MFDYIYLFLIEFREIFPKVIPIYQLNKAPAFSWKISIYISTEINADLQANLCLALKINSALYFRAWQTVKFMIPN